MLIILTEGLIVCSSFNQNNQFVVHQN